MDLEEIFIILILLITFFSGMVFFFIGLISSIKRRLTVYYDASDALISLILFSIISYIASFFTGFLNSGDVYYHFKEQLDGIAVGLVVSLLLNIAFIAYSFYMAYLYNRGRKVFIIAAFVARCVSPYLLTVIFNFIIIFVIGKSVNYTDLLFLAGNLVSLIIFLGGAVVEFFFMRGFIWLIDLLFSIDSSVNLVIFLVIITTVGLLIIPTFIRRFKFSDFRNYFNLKYLNSLSGELQEQYKKLEYRKSKQNIVKKSQL